MKKFIMLSTISLLTICSVLAKSTNKIEVSANILDFINLGHSQSEQTHNFDGDESYIITGEYGELGRKIKKPKVDNWQSEPMSFKLKVDPNKRNYITVKFWGGDVTHDHMIMLIDGKQMGYMHLGDYDILDYEACEPRDAPHSTNPNPQYPGRFTYTTFVLPEIATKGKSEIEVAIRAVGKIWGYGNNFAQFQKNVTQDSRGVYGVYIHENPFFNLTPEELTKIQVKTPVVPDNIPEIDIAAVKKRVEDEIKKSLKSDPTRDPWRLAFLSEAYNVPWTTVHKNDQVLKFIVKGIDNLAMRYTKEPDKVIAKGSWIGLSVEASAIMNLEEPLQIYLDEMIDNGSGEKVRRRDFWCDAFEASTFQLIRDRRWLANQSQIVDNSGHRTNRATHILDDKRGVPLEITLKFVKEALGILPWSNGVNPDLTNSNPKNTPGENYYQLTNKFLSKEWGYVGNYGESVIWTAADIYEGTIDKKTGKGDIEIFNLMVNAALARTIFRYPSVTVSNNPVMRLEVYIDWRNAHFPGEPIYVFKGLDLRTLYYTQNSQLLGCFQDMINDGYFNKTVAATVDNKNRKPNYTELLHFPERYETIQKLMSNATGNMPMRGKDFVFSDEENGVVAIKNGDDVIYFELYWRAKRGINNLAKIHYITPKSEHVATIYQDEEFIPSGKFNTEPDWVVYGFRGNRFDYPNGYYKQLRAGEKLPVAEHSKSETFIGKAEFYRCSYGRYEIGLNYSRLNKSYKLVVPQGEYKILPDGPIVKGGTTLEVKPETTIVLYKVK